MSKKIYDEKELENFNLNDMIPAPHTSSLGKKISPNISSENFQPDKNADTSNGNQATEECAGTGEIVNIEEAVETTTAKPMKKTLTSKQRKASLQEYQQTFLAVPKITDRKTVFISDELRRSVVDIVRKLGTEKSSVSGFVENMIRDHLSEYKDDVDMWKKL